MTPDERTPEERERARLERQRRRQGNDGESLPPPVAEERVAPPATPARPPRPAAPDFETIDETPAAGRHFVPPGATGRRRIAALVALAVAFAALWFVNSLFQPFAGAGKGEGSVLVTIPRGADVGAIGNLLGRQKIVGNGRFFAWRAGWSGRSSNFQAGRYRLGRGTSYSAAIDALVRGPNAGSAAITIAEGRSRYEIAQQTAAQGLRGDYMAASKRNSRLRPTRYGAPHSTSDLEGFLFPATYELPDNATVERTVSQQLTAFKRNLSQVSMSYAQTKKLSVFDVVTIASLIEREVQVPAERKLVAAVIYNRLKQGIPLGIDATTRFETRNWNKPLTGTQLRKDTPYNTRTRRGLPPGPIGNPGLASLRAAAHPAKVGYIYYVANPCKPGAHAFSSTYAEFQKDVQRYQRARDAAGGKAPSDC